VFHLPVTWVTLLAVPGFIVLSAELIVLGLILAIISVRYRDFIQIVASVLQLLFFVSPIFWQPGDRPVLQLVSDWNPISAMIALVRNPLLNELPSGPNLVVTAGGLAVLSALAFLIFARFRQRIIYWV
jgi:lipopolysaccharide transport system permease protein